MQRNQEGNSKSETPGTGSLNLMLEIEELEPIVAPALSMNSNETLVTDMEED